MKNERINFGNMTTGMTTGNNKPLLDIAKISDFEGDIPESLHEDSKEVSKLRLALRETMQLMEINQIIKLTVETMKDRYKLENIGRSEKKLFLKQGSSYTIAGRKLDIYIRRDY